MNCSDLRNVLIYKPETDVEIDILSSVRRLSYSLCDSEDPDRSPVVLSRMLPHLTDVRIWSQIGPRSTQTSLLHLSVLWVYHRRCIDQRIVLAIIALFSARRTSAVAHCRWLAIRQLWILLATQGHLVGLHYENGSGNIFISKGYWTHSPSTSSSDARKPSAL